MKMGRVVLIGLILVLVPVFAVAQPPASRPVPPPPSTLGNLRVSLLEGDVQIKTVDTGDWAPTSINIPLKEGDELWVPEAGRTEIQIMPATFVRLDQISSLAVMTVNKGAEQLYLTQGRAYINFNPDRGGMIQIDTPVSSVQVYGRAVFKMDVTEQGYTDVSVLDGTVYVESKSGKTTVEAGSVLSILAMIGRTGI
jgi:ferric-dicitrate binding protein FerR (iron transport regulator)